MLEIYNEQIQDLLVDPELKSGKNLQIWENKSYGVFVQDLSKHAVESYA